MTPEAIFARVWQHAIVEDHDCCYLYAGSEIEPYYYHPAKPDQHCWTGLFIPPEAYSRGIEHRGLNDLLDEDGEFPRVAAVFRDWEPKALDLLRALQQAHDDCCGLSRAVRRERLWALAYQHQVGLALVNPR